ncbi:hypothetical protein ACFQZ4_42515 [Catellatospora coxensis]
MGRGGGLRRPAQPRAAGQPLDVLPARDRGADRDTPRRPRHRRGEAAGRGFLDPADQGRWVGAFGPVADALALLAESRGDLAESLALRAAYLDLPPGPGRAGRCDEAAYLVRAALAQGEPALAEAAATAVAADPDPSPHRLLVMRFCRALVDADAVGLLTVASDFGQWAWLHHRALTLEEAAYVLAEQETWPVPGRPSDRRWRPGWIWARRGTRVAWKRGCGRTASGAGPGPCAADPPWAGRR